MTFFRKVLTTVFVATLTTVPAPADADELDVEALEYVDVIETTEGSIWKGFITEQTPNVSYKIATADGSVHVVRASDVIKVSKQRNKRYRVSRDTATRDDSSRTDLDTSDSDIARSTPVPLPTSGLRIDPELGVAVPRGDLTSLAGGMLQYRSSVSFGGRVGYEVMRGNVGWSFGGLLRATSWRLPVEIQNLGTHWTIESQVYGRGTLYMGRVAPYAGLSIGIDTNQTTNMLNGVSVTAVGLGMNLQSGVSIAASRAVAIQLGADFHPGTDTIEDGVDASVSYYAFHIGASLRL